MKNTGEMTIRLISILFCALVLTVAAEPARAVSDRKIEDARYACLSFLKGEQDSSRRRDAERSEVARFWLLGFLTGSYDAEQVLEFTEEVEAAEDEIVDKIKEYCADREDVSIHAAAVYAGESPHPVPAITNMGLDPRYYTCAAYSEGLKERGDARDQAKAAEFWAFAFVQGTMTVRYHPRVVVEVRDKRKIVRALKQSCQRNPGRTLLDQTAEIAGRVRPEWDQGDWD